MSYVIVRGDNDPLEIDLTENGRVQALDGAGMILNVRAPDGTAWTRTLSMGSKPGRAQYLWANAAETNALMKGEHRAHVRCTFGDGRIRTFPNDASGFPIHVVDAGGT